MPRYLGWLVFAVSALLVLAASLWLRYSLMEGPQWVDICLQPEVSWQCQLRAYLGLWIHFGVLSAAALISAVVAFFWPGKSGRVIAGLSFLLAIPALILYSASLGVLATVLALLRLVRDNKRPFASA